MIIGGNNKDNNNNYYSLTNNELNCINTNNLATLYRVDPNLKLILLIL